MTRDAIIKSIQSNENLIAYAFRVTNGDSLHEDIISEMVLSLYEMDEEKLSRLNESNELIPYCFKIVYLSWNGKLSPFYQKYRKVRHTEYDLSRCGNVEDESEYDEELDSKFSVASQFITDEKTRIEKDRFPTEIIVFEMYSEMGSYRRVAKKLRLPTMTVFNIIRDFKNKIQEAVYDKSTSNNITKAYGA